MIEIRACTPDDAAAVSTLLSELGYTVPIRQADREHPRAQQNGGGPNFCCRRGVYDGTNLAVV
jgi:hypothetical protein